MAKSYSLCLSRKQLILLSDFINAGFQFVDECDLFDLYSSPGYKDLKSLKENIDSLIDSSF